MNCLQSIQAAPNYVKPRPNLDWVETYRNIKNELNMHLYEYSYSCSSSSMKDSVEFLEKQHEEAKYCAAYEIPSYTQNCYQQIGYKLQNHFVSKYLDVQCLDGVYTPILNVVQEALMVDNDQLFGSVRNFAISELAADDFDLRQIYNDIVEAFQTQNYGCFQYYMVETRKFLEGLRSGAQQCTDDFCYAFLLHNFKVHFEGEDRQLAGARCFDLTYDPIRNRVYKALKLRDVTLIDAIKTFGDIGINDEISGNKNDPPSDGVMLHSGEQLVENPESETHIDFARVYYELKDGLNKKSYSCFQKYMRASKNELQAQHALGQLCLHYSDPTKWNSCFMGNYLQILEHFMSMREKLEGARCVDIHYQPILYEVCDGLKGSAEDVIEALKVFSSQTIEK